MKCSMRWHFIRICPAICKDWKNIILYILHTTYNTYSEWKGLTRLKCGSWSDGFIRNQLLWIHSVTKKDAVILLSQIYFRGKNSLRVWLLKWNLQADREWLRKQSDSSDQTAPLGADCSRLFICSSFFCQDSLVPALKLTPW